MRQLRFRVGTAGSLAFLLLLLEDLHVEAIRVRRVAAQRVLRDERADELLLVRVDEYAGLHDSPPPAPGSGAPP